MFEPDLHGSYLRFHVGLVSHHPKLIVKGFSDNYQNEGAHVQVPKSIWEATYAESSIIKKLKSL